MRSYGLEREVKTPRGGARHRARARRRRASGSWAPPTPRRDESGDAHKFTRELARMAAAKGVRVPLRHVDPRACAWTRGKVAWRRSPTSGSARRRRLRGGAGQLLAAPQPHHRHRPAGLSRSRAIRSRCDVTDAAEGARGEPHRRRGEARDVAPGQSPARRRHRGALRLLDRPQPGALRSASCAARARCSPERATTTSHFLDGPAALTPSNVPIVGRTPLPQPLPEHRPRHPRLDAGLRLRSAACGYHLGSQA